LTTPKNEHDVRLAFMRATKEITALTYQLQMMSEILSRLYEKLANAATKLEIAVDLSLEDDHGESAG